MEVKKLDNKPYIDGKAQVKLTTMGNITEIQYMSKRNSKTTVKKLSKHEYLVMSTGEIKEAKITENRAQQQNSLKKTFNKIRQYINTNVTDVSKARWITLTYAENMTDTTRLYEDFVHFNKRFKRWCKSNNYGFPEYINVVEPQARGAWHIHLLYLWNEEAPYIPNQELSRLWQQGFVMVRKLNDIDNIGAYLSAYLGDCDISEASIYNDISKAVSKEVIEDGKKVSKQIIKGGRLHMYPSGMNILRTSRGIKKPDIEMMTYSEAKEKASGGALTYSSSLELTDGDFSTLIVKEEYNRLRKTKQDN